MSDFGHANEDTAQLAARGNAERLHVIREDRWIDYPQATSVLTVLNEILARPRTTRMASVAIYADSGMGKPCCCSGFCAASQLFRSRSGHRANACPLVADGQPAE
jgi:Bacterial TniB protein